MFQLNSEHSNHNCTPKFESMVILCLEFTVMFDRINDFLTTNALFKQNLHYIIKSRDLKGLGCSTMCKINTAYLVICSVIK